MRQVLSSGSVKAFCLNREELLKELSKISGDALKMFPEIEEIRLFGSLAREDQTGLSDVDIFLILAATNEKNPLERMKPYYSYFSARLELALDMIVATKDELDNFTDILRNSVLMKEATQKNHPLVP